MLGISFAGAITRSFGEEDAKSVATPPAAQEKLLRDSEADGRLRDALKDTAVDLLDMVPITGGTYRMGSAFDLGSEPGGWLLAALIGDPSMVDQGPQHEVLLREARQ